MFQGAGQLEKHCHVEKPPSVCDSQKSGQPADASMEAQRSVRVQGLGFRVQGLRVLGFVVLGIQGLGFDGDFRDMLAS